MAEKFKIGDIVQLKSGGPTMTVTEVQEWGTMFDCVMTTWFVGKKKEKGSFPLDAVVICKEKAK